MIGTAVKGDLDCINEVLSYPNVDVDQADEDGYTPSMSASYQGHAEVVRIHINKRNDNGETAFMIESSNGHNEIVRLLLAVIGRESLSTVPDTLHKPSGIDINKQGQTSIVEALLAVLGIDVNIHDHTGSTALMLACYNGHADVVKALLARIERGIDDGLPSTQY